VRRPGRGGSAAGHRPGATAPAQGATTAALSDDGLQERAAAALRLIALRELDPYIALSYVCWPSERLAAARAAPRQKKHSADTRRRALELVDSGMSWTQAARAVGVSKGAVGDWVQRRRAGAVRVGA
jgi:Homeodomain-like domain